MVMVQSRRISPKAARTACIPKKITDQAIFSNNCTANRIKGNLAAGQPASRQTSQELTAIIRYSEVHARPKTQLGGFHAGFLSCGYQVWTELLVYREPMPAAARQITANGTSDSHESRLSIRSSSSPQS